MIKNLYSYRTQGLFHEKFVRFVKSIYGWTILAFKPSFLNYC